MKRFFFLFLFLSPFFLIKADLLTDITDGRFYPKTPAAFYSMNDGEHFSQLIEGKYIVKFEFKTGLAVDTLFRLNTVKGYPYQRIISYLFSGDENKILIHSKRDYRYRRSFTADYYVYDIKKNTLTKLSENGDEEIPQFSPDGNQVAFVRKNNIYLKNLNSGAEIAVTTDGEFNKIINGTADWVYEEEFETTHYFYFSPEGTDIAFVKFDESKVPFFSMIKYLNPSLPEDSLLLYPIVETFKYPKAGEPNSTVSVHIYNIANKTTKKVELSNSFKEFYVPRIKWTADPNQLAVYVLNRYQNELNMYFVNKNDFISSLVWSDTDSRYVDYDNVDKMHFLSGNKSFIYLSEKDGWRHAYIYDIAKKTSKLLTKGDWDITDIYGFDEKRNLLFYQSAEISPMQRDIYSVSLKGKKSQLTDAKGTHDADFSTTFSYFADNFSSLGIPNIVTLRDYKGKAVRELINNNDLLTLFDSFHFPKKRFFQFTTSEGVTLNGWILEPDNMKKDETYPLLMVQYSGPNSQQVLDRWSVGWEYFLSTQGYAVACVDGRGTGARGVEFRKCTYKQLGVLEPVDQIEAAKYLGTLPFVDKNRIGIWGWSYGGFMVLNSMSSGEKVFKAGIAVAPVTNWRFYDSAYTERYMSIPQENGEGYDKGSPITKVDKLQGNLLLIAGTADDNVHLQNSMVYVDKLTDANKQIEMYTYTDKNHSILGRNTRRHLYRKKFDFLEKNLK